MRCDDHEPREDLIPILRAVHASIRRLCMLCPRCPDIPSVRISAEVTRCALGLATTSVSDAPHSPLPDMSTFSRPFVMRSSTIWTETFSSHQKVCLILGHAAPGRHL